ncbi:MAG: nucleotidyltransferase family protein [Oscillospiraceae bacterium]|nr:nucleotidyltransferase family protein [Oscillospiraceae bacterium]
MPTVGIVCEYNPFHLGHLNQLKETRRMLGGDAATVCVMSGDFVQRGEAAVFDKFARAEAACRCGANLVVELPLPWCLSSAEGFAFGAVSILAALGCDTLSFGSESADLSALSALADFALDENAQAQMHALMDADASLSFARARQLAAEEAIGGAAALLSDPNDILAVEYLKAIKRTGAQMRPLAIRRTGAGHNSAEEGEYPSAMRLRKLLQNGNDISAHVPQPAMEVFRREQMAGRSRDEKLLEVALLSRLYRLNPEDFDALPDAGGGAGRRLYRALWQTGGLEQTVKAASGKRCTAARMRRMLLCAALGICAEDTKGMPPYIRILASDEKGRAHISRIRGNTALPVINKTAEIKKLGFQGQKVFKLCAEAHELYRLCCPMPERPEPGEDWRRTQTIV